MPDRKNDGGGNLIGGVANRNCHSTITGSDCIIPVKLKGYQYIGLIVPDRERLSLRDRSGTTFRYRQDEWQQVGLAQAARSGIDRMAQRTLQLQQTSVQIERRDVRSRELALDRIHDTIGDVIRRFRSCRLCQEHRAASVQNVCAGCIPQDHLPTANIRRHDIQVRLLHGSRDQIRNIVSRQACDPLRRTWRQQDVHCVNRGDAQQSHDTVAGINRRQAHVGTRDRGDHTLS